MPQIHQEVVLHTTPKRIYEALTMRSSSVRFSGGAPADISAEVGSSFSCFGGLVLGRNIELIPNPRVVQAWRAKTWESGVYSSVRKHFAWQQQESTTSGREDQS